MSGEPVVDVDVYVHAAGTSVWEEQGRFVRYAEELADRGLVDRVSVQALPRRVCTTGGLERTAFHRDALSTIERLEAWSDREDVALPFEHHTVASEFTGSEHEVIDTPAVCVAGRDRDEEVLWVYPHRHRSTACTVEDLMERVARRGAVSQGCQPEPRSSVVSPSAKPTDGA